MLSWALTRIDAWESAPLGSLRSVHAFPSLTGIPQPSRPRRLSDAWQSSLCTVRRDPSGADSTAGTNASPQRWNSPNRGHWGLIVRRLDDCTPPLMPPRGADRRCPHFGEFKRSYFVVTVQRKRKPEVLRTIPCSSEWARSFGVPQVSCINGA